MFTVTELILCSAAGHAFTDHNGLLHSQSVVLSVLVLISPAAASAMRSALQCVMAKGCYRFALVLCTETHTHTHTYTERRGRGPREGERHCLCSPLGRRLQCKNTQQVTQANVLCSA